MTRADNRTGGEQPGPGATSVASGAKRATAAQPHGVATRREGAPRTGFGSFFQAYGPTARIAGAPCAGHVRATNGSGT